MNEEHAEFLESLDGQKREVEVLEQLATAEGRFNYSVACIIKKNGQHRYRALFDEDYRKRSNPGKERLDELKEEFDTMQKSFHKQALIYYKGPMEDKELEKEIEQDQKDVQEKFMQGMGPPESDDEFDLGLDDWNK